MTTFSVDQSGTSVDISSNAAGFTQNSLYQYYLNSGNLSNGSDSFVITFGDGASIRLTDFNEIPFFSGSSSNESVIGIPSSAEGGFTNTINLIGGYGYFSTFDIYDDISGELLIDDYQPQDGFSGYFEPIVQLGYTSGNLTISAPTQTTGSSYGSASIDSLNGTINYTEAVSGYVGGAGGTPVSQYISGGSGSPWIFALTTPEPICFVEGTSFNIFSGSCKKIENLEIGEYVETVDGFKPIKWVAKKFYPPSIVKQFPRVLPIRFKKDSLSKGVPSHDLFVSQKHALIFNCKAIPAEILINGLSIVQCTADEFIDGITYFHLEFEKCEIIKANGALSTSYVDVGNRVEFDNFNEYKMLYGNVKPLSLHGYTGATKVEYRTLRKVLFRRSLSLC